MRRPITILLTLATLLMTGAGCSLSGSGQAAPAPVTLEYWRMDDAPSAMDEVIANYQKTRPYVTVHVTRIDAKDYERTLLEALAEKRGPDLFNVRNVDLHAWLGKVAPLPKETAVPVQAMGADKKIAWTAKKTPSLTQLELRNTFVEGAVKDVLRTVYDETAKANVASIYGLPLSMDTLALLYNQELFKKASIQAPPTTWGDFQQLAARLTVKGQDGQLLQAGTSLGGADNERYAADLLAGLMGQNGVLVTDDYGASFSEKYSRPVDLSADTLPPAEAATFYQSFAVPNTAAYSWNEQMPDSLDAFVQGRLAMFFGTPADFQAIRERAPKLDVAVAAVPQIDERYRYNVALYPIEVVSAASPHADVAWDFLQFAAKAGNVDSFLAATRRPTALRGLIDAQAADPELGVYSQQALKAVTWYRGENYERARTMLKDIINFRPTEEEPDVVQVINATAMKVTNDYLRSK